MGDGGGPTTTMALGLGHGETEKQAGERESRVSASSCPPGAQCGGGDGPTGTQVVVRGSLQRRATGKKMLTLQKTPLASFSCFL